jgi:hypothetical protein
LLHYWNTRFPPGLLAIYIRDLFGVSQGHGLADIGGLVVGEEDAEEGDFGGQVGGGEGLGTGDDEMIGGAGLGGQGGTVLDAAADDPLGGLADHFALVIQQETDGAGGGDGLGQLVGQGQGDDGFLAGDFGRGDGDGQLGLGAKNAQAKPDQELSGFHDCKINRSFACCSNLSQWLRLILFRVQSKELPPIRCSLCQRPTPYSLSAI